MNQFNIGKTYKILMVQLEIGKKYKLTDDECEAELRCCEVSYDGHDCELIDYTPFVIIKSDNILSFQGNGFCTIGGSRRELCVFSVEVPKGPPATVAFEKSFRMCLMEINSGVSEQEENHKGQIYNPYTDTWSWF